MREQGRGGRLAIARGVAWPLRWRWPRAAATSVGGGSDEDGADREVQRPVEGELTISNWPGYIDPGKNGTVAEFEDETGIEVDYIEDVNDNVTFFGKLQPQLDQGESGGRDMFVVTDWMAKQMYDLGYLQELDHADLRTVFDNILPQFEENTTDPERKYLIPWQGGLTGIWVDTSKAPEISRSTTSSTPSTRAG